MTPSIDRLTSLERAAESLQLAPSTLRRWLRSGRIRGHRLDPTPWLDLLDFTAAQPSVYYRVSEVLADASRSGEARSTIRGEVMELETTWIVKVRMSDPQAIAEAPSTGPDVFTEGDVEQLLRRLRDGLPFDAPRRLESASLEDDGTIIAFFETSTEPSLIECKALYHLTARASAPFRRPRKFDCVKSYPIIAGKVGYQV
jgi:hypothetical protein